MPEHRPEQEARAHGQDRSARQRQADHRNIERDGAGDRRDPVGGNELVDGGAMPDQRFERQIAMQAETVGERDQHDDDGDRREPPQHAMAIARGAGRRDAIVGGRASQRMLADEWTVLGCIDVASRWYTRAFGETKHLTDF